jgi:hypothetical protein
MVGRKIPTKSITKRLRSQAELEKVKRTGKNRESRP